jgi:Cd2+/Zn2+-exporting ATPase
VQDVTLELPVILPSGPECERCILRLQDDLQRVKGVSAAAVNNARTAISVSFDPNVVTVGRIEQQARYIGAQIAERIDHLTLALRDVDCPDCCTAVERVLAGKPGVLWASANFAAGQAHIEFERGKIGPKELVRAVESAGVTAIPAPPATDEMRRELSEILKGDESIWIRHRRAVVTAVALLATAAGIVVQRLGDGETAVALFAGAIVVGGWTTARAALLAARARVADMNTLMTIAVLGAIGIGEWAEGASVVALFSLGNLLQNGAIDRTRRSIRALMDLTPRTARVLRGRGEFEVPVESVRLYETVLVKPGESIPLDGELLDGETTVNQAPITGESSPLPKKAGDFVYAGSLNGEGAIRVKVLNVFRDTVLTRLIHRVEEAQAQRAPAQLLVDRFARKYTPAVVALAVAVALVPPLWDTAMHAMVGATLLPWIWLHWFERALTLLVIACPCALVISTPVAVVTAIGAASRAGALIKGGAFLEEIGNVRAIVYDKTGTLTEGRFRIEDVVPLDSMSGNDVLRYAAAIEAHSEHPLAAAFTEVAAAYPQGALPAVTSFQSLPGLGARANIGSETYLVGNPTLLARWSINGDGAGRVLERVEALKKTAVVLASPDRALGVIVLSDTPRVGLAEAVRELRALGVRYQCLLTGDNAHVAQEVASLAGIEEFKACLLPEQKQSLIREYQQRYGSVAMVGDGVNDAPALAAANVGIAMGAAASDTALETADIALLGNDLRKLPALVRLSRRTQAIIRQNIFLSIGTKAGLLVAAVVVGIPLWLAVVGDVGIALLVTANALRLAGKVE